MHRGVFCSWPVLSTSWVGDSINAVFRAHGEVLSNYANKLKFS